MSNGQTEDPPDREQRSREPLTRSNLAVPTSRLTLKPRTVVAGAAKARDETPVPNRRGAGSRSATRRSRPTAPAVARPVRGRE